MINNESNAQHAQYLNWRRKLKLSFDEKILADSWSWSSSLTAIKNFSVNCEVKVQVSFCPSFFIHSFIRSLHHGCLTLSNLTTPCFWRSFLMVSRLTWFLSVSTSIVHKTFSSVVWHSFNNPDLAFGRHLPVLSNYISQLSGNSWAFVLFYVSFSEQIFVACYIHAQMNAFPTFLYWFSWSLAILQLYQHLLLLLSL